MCELCKLDAMTEGLPENPNPQMGRVYPKGWDLNGYSAPEPLPGRVGSEDDDTARVIYEDAELALDHMTLAQAFTGHPMEMFFDGKYTCYRPAILKRNKPQPPAWHVVKFPDGRPQRSEQDERDLYAQLEQMIREAGGDPDEFFGNGEIGS